MSNVKAINDAQFEDEVLRSEKPVVVDFWAEWCGPCKQFAPILDEIAGDHSRDLVFMKINVDENPETSSSFQISSIPTIHVFRGGEVVKTIVGVRPKGTMLKELAEFFA